MNTVALEDLVAETILSFCENLAELGCPSSVKDPDMWFRYLSPNEQVEVASKLLYIMERNAKNDVKDNSCKEEAFDKKDVVAGYEKMKAMGGCPGDCNFDMVDPEMCECCEKDNDECPHCKIKSVVDGKCSYCGWLDDDFLRKLDKKTELHEEDEKNEIEKRYINERIRAIQFDIEQRPCTSLADNTSEILEKMLNLIEDIYQRIKNENT